MSRAAIAAVVVVLIGLMVWSLTGGGAATGPRAVTPDQPIVVPQPVEPRTGAIDPRDPPAVDETGLRSPVPVEPGPTPYEAVGTPWLRFLVRDARGRPHADVPLRIGQMRGGYLRRLWRGATDADGAAAVTDLGELTGAEATEPLDPNSTVVAFVDLPIAPPPSTGFRLAEPPREPIEFILPLHGSVRIDLDTTGAQTVHGVKAGLRILDLPPDEARFHTIEVDAMNDGSATFPIVGLGLRLAAVVEVAGASEPRTVEFDGPRAPGQESRVVVRLVDDESVILARLLDPDGDPLASVELDMVWKASGGNSSTESSRGIEPDPEGRVRIAREDDLGDDADRSLIFRHSARSIAIEVALPKPLRGGVTDLGDLRLVAPPLFVAGLVVDALGEPIADASVEVHALDGGNVRTAADGGFEVRAPSGGTDDPLELTAQAVGYLDSPPIAITFGMRGLIVRLERAGAVAGEILADDLDVPFRMRFELRDVITGETQLETLGSGAYRLDTVKPGILDITIRIAGHPEPLARRSSVQVRGGETTTLSTFDLRGKLRRVRFRVVDESGTPVRDANALILSTVPLGELDPCEGVMVSDGHGEVVTTGFAVDLYVFADGFAALRANGVRDDTELVLEGAFRVHVQLASGVVVPGGFDLRVRVDRLDDPFPEGARYVFRGRRGSRSMMGGHPWPDEDQVTLDANGHGEVALPSAGRYGLHAVLRPVGGDAAISVGLEGLSPGEFTVVDGRRVTTVMLDIEAKALADAAGRFK